MTSTATSPVESKVVRKLMWRLLPFLFVLYIIAYLDRTNVSFAFLQMRNQLALNDRAYGLGAGVFFAGYFLFQLPSNLILARVGARRWIAGIMMLWGLVSAAMIFATGPRSFYLLRFLLGAAEAGFFPGMILYLKNWFPASARGRAVALFMTAAPLSGVIGGPISGALLGVHWSGLSGWQWLFLIEGIPAVVFGGVVMLVLSERPESATWLADEERLLLAGILAAERQAASTSPNLKTAFTHPGVWILCSVYFGLTCCVYGITLWLPSVIRSLSGFSNFTIGVLTALPNLVAAVAMVLIALHSDRSGERRWHTAIAAFAATTGLVTMAYSHSTLLVLLGTSLAIAGAYGMDGPFWAMPASLLTGTAAAAGIAVINSVGNLGGFFGPYIIGLARTADAGFRGGMLLIAAILAVSGSLALAVRIRKAE